MEPTTPLGSRRAMLVYPAAYSPADVPSSTRACAAMKRMLSFANGRSELSVSLCGLPVWAVSISARRWRSLSRWSASLFRSAPRSAGVIRDHFLNALRAALTARSTSSTFPFGMVPTTFSLAGLITSVLSPETDSTSFPSMIILRSAMRHSLLRRARRTHRTAGPEGTAGARSGAASMTVALVLFRYFITRAGLGRPVRQGRPQDRDAACPDRLLGSELPGQADRLLDAFARADRHHPRLLLRRQGTDQAHVASLEPESRGDPPARLRAGDAGWSRHVAGEQPESLREGPEPRLDLVD